MSFCFLEITRFFLKGLRVGDEVIEFGSVNAGNFQNLQNIASVVQHSEGVIDTVTLIFCFIYHITSLHLSNGFVVILGRFSLWGFLLSLRNMQDKFQEEFGW